jgi:hypothetical protein
MQFLGKKKFSFSSVMLVEAYEIETLMTGLSRASNRTVDSRSLCPQDRIQPQE